MSREDPKHGRWILPLVVAGLIFFTWVFVNNLNQAEVAGGTTTTAAPGSATTTTTTTAGTGTTTSTTSTTLPPAVQAFRADVVEIDADTRTLLGDALEINQQWDDREIGLSVIDSELVRIRDETIALRDRVKSTTPPEPATAAWSDVVTAVEDMSAAAQGMLDGLRGPSAGPRVEGLAAYQTAAEAAAESLTEASALAG